VSIQLCTRSRLRRKTKPVSGCALPVESGDGLWRTVEKRGKLPRRRPQTRNAQNPALSSYRPMAADAVGRVGYENRLPARVSHWQSRNI